MPAREIPQKLRERREVNVVVDALLGTGVKGPPQGRILELIRATREFPVGEDRRGGFAFGAGRRRGMRARGHHGDFHRPEGGALSGGRRGGVRRTADRLPDRMPAATA